MSTITSGEKLPVCSDGWPCGRPSGFTGFGSGGAVVAQAESVICTLILTGAHPCDISPVLRETRWAEWYHDASQMHADLDGELIVSLPIASLQEAQEALQLTSNVKCSLGRQLCFVARGEKIAHVNLSDSGKGWQELSGSFY